MEHSPDMAHSHDTTSNKRLRNQLDIQQAYFNSTGRPRVCELYAGVAVMSRIFADFGFVVSMLSEVLQHLHGFQADCCPEADLQGDCIDKPWIRWREAGMLALIIIAGVSCQPFPDAGPRRFGADDRAWDACLVCDATVELDAVFIILENVYNYIDLDHVHGVWSRILGYFNSKGYSLVRVLRPKHHYC